MVTGIPGIGDLISLSSIYGYSKDLEREADAEGFQRLQAAGYDVSQAPVTFEFLLAEVEALEIDEPYFFSTHPALEERIKNFRELVQQHGTMNGYKRPRSIVRMLTSCNWNCWQTTWNSASTRACC